MANGKCLKYGNCELTHSVIGEKITSLPLKIPSFKLFVQKKGYISDMPDGKLLFLIEYCLLYALKTTGFAERKQMVCDHKAFQKLN